MFDLKACNETDKLHFVQKVCDVASENQAVSPIKTGFLLHKTFTKVGSMVSAPGILCNDCVTSENKKTRLKLSRLFVKSHCKTIT